MLEVDLPGGTSALLDVDFSALRYYEEASATVPQPRLESMLRSAIEKIDEHLLEFQCGNGASDCLQLVGLNRQPPSSANEFAQNLASGDLSSLVKTIEKQNTVLGMLTKELRVTTDRASDAERRQRDCRRLLEVVHRLELMREFRTGLELRRELRQNGCGSSIGLYFLRDLRKLSAAVVPAASPQSGIASVKISDDDIGRLGAAFDAERVAVASMLRDEFSAVLFSQHEILREEKLRALRESHSLCSLSNSGEMVDFYQHCGIQKLVRKFILDMIYNSKLLKSKCPADEYEVWEEIRRNRGTTTVKFAMERALMWLNESDVYWGLWLDNNYNSRGTGELLPNGFSGVLTSAAKELYAIEFGIGGPRRVKICLLAVYLHALLSVLRTKIERDFESRDLRAALRPEMAALLTASLDHILTSTALGTPARSDCLGSFIPSTVQGFVEALLVRDCDEGPTADLHDLRSLLAKRLSTPSSTAGAIALTIMDRVESEVRCGEDEATHTSAQCVLDAIGSPLDFAFKSSTGHKVMLISANPEAEMEAILNVVGGYCHAVSWHVRHYGKGEDSERTTMVLRYSRDVSWLHSELKKGHRLQSLSDLRIFLSEDHSYLHYDSLVVISNSIKAQVAELKRLVRDCLCLAVRRETEGAIDEALKRGVMCFLGSPEGEGREEIIDETASSLCKGFLTSLYRLSDSESKGILVGALSDLVNSALVPKLSLGAVKLSALESSAGERLLDKSWDGMRHLLERMDTGDGVLDKLKDACNEAALLAGSHVKI